MLTRTGSTTEIWQAATAGSSARNAVGGGYTYRAIAASQPVNYVSFWDAARFSNWLTSGRTEWGVYQLRGVTNPTNNTITRNATVWAMGGVAVASEDEWYKAAYYSGLSRGADGDGYWSFPNQSNSITTAEANYGGSVGDLTDVGSYAVPSFYGTFDQGGNVWEWNDTILITSNRGALGGSFSSPGSFSIESLGLGDAYSPDNESADLGFRISSLQAVASTPVIPEPSASAAICGFLGLGLALSRRKARF